MYKRTPSFENQEGGVEKRLKDIISKVVKQQRGPGKIGYLIRIGARTQIDILAMCVSDRGPT